MSPTSHPAHRLLLQNLAILGIALYVASFLLPIGGIDAADGISGWRWTWASFLGAATGFAEVGRPANARLFESPLWTGLYSLMCGSLNLLVPIYLWLNFTGRARVVRISLVAALMIFAAASWKALSLLYLTPFIGYYVWIGGILLIPARELGPQPERYSRADKDDGPIRLKL